MASNVEIKAVARDFDRQRALAEEFCGEPAAELIQRDTFFQVPVGRLKLRDFADGRGELIQYCRPDQASAKTSDYLLVPTDEPEKLREALTRALEPAGEVRKRRWLYLWGQTRIHFDEVQQLGWYIELEVVMRPDQPITDGQAIATDIMRRLEISAEDLIDSAYIDLLHAAE